MILGRYKKDSILTTFVVAAETMQITASEWVTSQSEKSVILSCDLGANLSNTLDSSYFDTLLLQQDFDQLSEIEINDPEFVEESKGILTKLGSSILKMANLTFGSDQKCKKVTSINFYTNSMIIGF